MVDTNDAEIVTRLWGIYESAPKLNYFESSGI